jgi:transcriptional regulator with XRE-family HTH domain
MILLRRLLGDVLRRQRQRQGRTLREVSSSARVSLGYLSEVERGQKEASSELLSAICDALDVRMSELMREVSDELALAELAQSAAAGQPVPVRSMLNPMSVTSVTSVTGVAPERVTIKAPAEAVDVVAA